MAKYSLICLFGYFAAILSIGNSVALPEPSDSNTKADEPPSKRTALENNSLQFAVNVKEIENSTGKCVELSENVLNTVPWNISICKKTKNVNQVEVPFLQVSMATSRWSFETQGNIKLLKTENSKEIELKRSFNSGNPSHDFEIEDWEKLGEYKNGEEINFEINLSISSLKRSSPIKKATTKFYVKVKDVTSVSDIYSPEIAFAGIKWKILNRKTDKGLAIYLCAVDEDMHQNETWEIEYTFKLLSNDETIAPAVRTYTHKFNWKSLAFGYKTFITSDELNDSKNQYLDNEAAIFQIELTLKTYT